MMKVTWRTTAGTVSVEIAFSTLLRVPPDGTRMGVRLDDGATVYSEPCRLVRGLALDCRFATLQTLPGGEATLLVPRRVTSTTGQAITLWASAESRVEFQR